MALCKWSGCGKTASRVVAIVTAWRTHTLDGADQNEYTDSPYCADHAEVLSGAVFGSYTSRPIEEEAA